jgi:uncharacterized protein (DUF362 family)
MSDLTRRSFIAGGAALVAGTAAAGCLPAVDGHHDDSVCSYTPPTITMAYPAQAGRVIEHQSLDILSTPGGDSLDEKVAKEALEKVLLTLTGKAALHQAWDVLLPDYKATEVVGIKVNVLNPKVPTHPDWLKVLVALLKTKGIKGDKIVVWDRRMDELIKAGYDDKELGCRLEATLDAPGDKGAGWGYELDSVCVAGKKARLTNLQTRVVDHLINIAVLKSHGVTGYTGVLKNHYGTIDNPGDFHGSIHKKAIPAINALDEVAQKSRLWLLDAVFGVSQGDTDSVRDCTPLALAASLDPVALDAYGRALRDRQPQAKKETLSDGWLQASESMGLGKVKIKAEKPA